MFNRKLLLLAAVPLMFGLVACSSGDDGDNTESSPGGIIEEPTTEREEDTPAVRDLRKVADEYAKVDSFRASLNVEGDPQTAQQGEIEAVMPDRYHARYTGATTEQGQIEIILIGQESYFKVDDNPWTKQETPGASGEMINTNSLDSMVDSLQGAGVTKGGKSSVDGKECQVYSATNNGISQELCVADNLPLRYVTETPDGIKTTLTFSDYNDDDINIEAPI